MSFTDQIRAHRLDLGLTQVQLSAQAGVALPTLQNLESGKSNPSLETLQRLAEIIGLSLELRPRACDWNLLASWGVPLLSAHVQTRAPQSNFKLISELRAGLRELDSPEALDPRAREAFAAYLTALHDHYPETYRRGFAKNVAAAQLLHSTRRGGLSGRLLKLRRIALARMAEYL